MDRGFAMIPLPERSCTEDWRKHKKKLDNRYFVASSVLGIWHPTAVLSAPSK